MEGFIIFIIVAGVLWFWIKIKTEENEHKKQIEIAERDDAQLKRDYPDGYLFYKNYKDQFNQGAYNYYTRSATEMASLRYKIIDKQHKIDDGYKKNAEEFTQLSTRQKEFNKICIDICKKELTFCGYYYYDIPWPKRTNKTGNINTQIRVRQIFVESLCLNQELDYSLYTSAKRNFDNLSEFKSHEIYFVDRIYDNINSFLDKLAHQYKRGILFNREIEGWSPEVIQLHYDKILRDIPNTKVLSIDRIPKTRVTHGGGCAYIYPAQWPISIPEDINFLIVIDAYTENTVLKESCKEIYKLDNPPCVLYLSLLKCYDKDEMVEILEKRKVEHEKELAENQRKIEEQKKLTEEKKRAETWINLKKLCTGKKLESYFKIFTSKWLKIDHSDFPFFALYNYYPTTCEWEADDDVWYTRNLIWEFKASPTNGVYTAINKNEKESADIEVEEAISETLTKMFGPLTKFLTFFPIPASTSDVNCRRYETFSNQLCKELDMQNGYPHIHYQKDGEAKHLGGTKSSQIEIDKNFFKDTYVILFDDVITRGNTMLKYRTLLTSIGANVIAGISLGVTHHHYRSEDPIDLIDNYMTNIILPSIYCHTKDELSIPGRYKKIESDIIAYQSIDEEDLKDIALPFDEIDDPNLPF